VMEKEGFLAHVQAMGKKLKEGLLDVQAQFPAVIEEVRGVGLLLGIRIGGSHYALAERLRAAGLLTSPATDHVIRIIPPLIVSEGEIGEALAIIGKICKETL